LLTACCLAHFPPLASRARAEPPPAPPPALAAVTPCRPRAHWPHQHSDALLEAQLYLGEHGFARSTALLAASRCYWRGCAVPPAFAARPPPAPGNRP
jgi:hypothetical protein